MDLRQYYLAIQQVENTIQDNAVVVVSTATDDGGRAGTLSEVTRHTAARMIIEGRALLATDEQKAHYALWREGPPNDTCRQTTVFETFMPSTSRSAVTRPRKR
jgi:polyphosphate kinase 2 (PPK2 family)